MKYGRLQRFWLQQVGDVLMASYICKACNINYTVNKPLSWDMCTPDFCHECTKDLDKVRALFAP